MRDDCPCLTCKESDECKTRGIVAWVEDTAHSTLKRQLNSIGSTESAIISIEIEVVECDNREEIE